MFSNNWCDIVERTISLYLANTKRESYGLRGQCMSTITDTTILIITSSNCNIFHYHLSNHILGSGNFCKSDINNNDNFSDNCHVLKRLQHVMILQDLRCTCNNIAAPPPPPHTYIYRREVIL